MMYHQLISIIVPVYKVEDYLPRCIDSIIQQTYHNIEIILVDDGSPDKSGKICDKYAQKDTRIRVIHKKNGGQADARNIALDKATGEYIVFVDGDDFVAEDYVECLYALVANGKAQIGITLAQIFEEGTIPLVDNRKNVPVNMMDCNQAIISMFYQKDFDTAPWGKIFQKDLFREMRFPTLRAYEDLGLIYRLIQRCTNVAFCKRKTYYYLLRKSSTEGSPFNPNKYDSAIKILAQLEQDRREMSPAVQRALDCRMLSFLFHVLLEIPKDYPEMRMNLMRKIKILRNLVMFDKNARKKARLAALLSYGGNTIVSVLFSWINKRKKEN